MKYSYKTILIIILLIVVIIIFNSYTKKKEPFQTNNNNNNSRQWPPDLIKRFVIYQNTVNLNNHQFNLQVLQQQASPEEVEYLLETGFWPWTDDLKYQYMDKIWDNPIIKIQPQIALNYAMRLYNQHAATELLGWNTKEGHFLLYGGDLGVTQGMPKNVHNTLKCTNDTNNNSVMKKTIYTKMNYWNGYMDTKTETVKNEDIPTQMPGFTFEKGPCNPCSALNTPADFSCPFKLNIKGDDSISSVWKTLWNL